jgi:small-conductance mechanosensitive channel
MLRLLLSLIAALCAAVGILAAAQAAPSEAGPPATVRLLNRDIVTLRATVFDATPEQRVWRIEQRLRDVPASEIDAPLRLLDVHTDGIQGIQILLGSRALMTLTTKDVDAESGQTLQHLAEQTRQRLEDLRAAYRDTVTGANLRSGLLRAVIATAVLGVLLWVGWVGTGRLLAWMKQKRDAWAAVHAHVDWREFMGNVLVYAVRVVQVGLAALLLYLWLTRVLGGFAATEPLAQALTGWFFDTLGWLWRGTLASIPGIATVAIVLGLTNAVASAVQVMFNGVRDGRLRLPGVHPETSTATRRLVTLTIWALGIAIAYPYLPGSSSDAFKGLSVLLGLMVTLGSAGIVTQGMSGLVIIYSRALKKGDFVRVGEVEGVVSEVAALATKVVNIRNEEVTIPNAVLVANPIHNYSKLAGTQGTLLSTKVTIGYDAPWRQVHALLKQAAAATEGLRTTPEPRVFQRALSDFYVEYELLFAIDRPIERVPTLSRLHAAIQDAFNEAGVQIMSPHFFAQPERPVIVPKSQWEGGPPAAAG